MSFLIKICGLTSAADVRMVTEAGADAVGVNFWSGSKRFVGDAAAEVLAAVPPGVLKFGVFVNAPPDLVRETADRYALDRVQLHGDERPSDFVGFSSSLVVRAIRVRDARSLAEADSWAATADLLLFDAFVEGYGGGGTPAPWSDIAAAASSASVRPFLLAGGLTPANVAAAVRATHPAGVDVASGVESAPGKKDGARVAAFIRAARATAK